MLKNEDMQCHLKIHKAHRIMDNEVGITKKVTADKDYLSLYRTQNKHQRISSAGKYSDFDQCRDCTRCQFSESTLSKCT